MIQIETVLKVKKYRQSNLLFYTKKFKERNKNRQITISLNYFENLPQNGKYLLQKRSLAESLISLIGSKQVETYVEFNSGR